MIEAAYANLDGADFWAQRPLSLGVDKGGLRARRLIQDLRRREQEDGRVGSR